jgi:four helix bundle protein
MSKQKSILIDKSFLFAIRTVKLFQHLSGQKKEFVLSKQLLKSGTSIGANIREAFNAESKNDFIHKLAIAQKESDETCYWLELLSATQFLSEEEFNSISKDSIELLKLLRSSILTAKQNLKKTHS